VVQMGGTKKRRRIEPGHNLVPFKVKKRTERAKKRRGSANRPEGGNGKTRSRELMEPGGFRRIPTGLKSTQNLY